MASMKDMKKVTKPKANYLTHDEIAEVIKNQQQTNQNNIVAGIYGQDGTGKSGIALELRTQDDIDTGRKLFIMDFDKGVLPLINEYYTVDGVRDPNIILLDPTVRIPEGENRGGVDFKSTIQMTMSMLFYIDELGQGEVAGCILDGLDTWLKTCEYNMRENELEHTKDKTAVKQMDWYIRDKPHNQALMLTKSLPCPTVYITHMKDIYNGYENGQLMKVDEEPFWGKLVPNQMFQKIFCYGNKDKKTKITTFYAEIQKSKGRLNLESKKIEIASVKNEKDFKWNGFSWDIFR